MAITTQPRVPQIRQPNTRIMAGVFGAVVLALVVAGAAFVFTGNGADDTPAFTAGTSSASTAIEAHSAAIDAVLTGELNEILGVTSGTGSVPTALEAHSAAIDAVLIGELNENLGPSAAIVEHGQLITWTLGVGN